MNLDLFDDSGSGFTTSPQQNDDGRASNSNRRKHTLFFPFPDPSIGEPDPIVMGQLAALQSLVLNAQVCDALPIARPGRHTPDAHLAPVLAQLRVETRRAVEKDVKRRRKEQQRARGEKNDENGSCHDDESEPVSAGFVAPAKIGLFGQLWFGTKVKQEITAAEFDMQPVMVETSADPTSDIQNDFNDQARAATIPIGTIAKFVAGSAIVAAGFTDAAEAVTLPHAVAIRATPASFATMIAASAMTFGRRPQRTYGTAGAREALALQTGATALDHIAVA